MASRKELSGQKIGNATVIKPIHIDGKKKLYWLCKCDCGNEFISTSYQLNHNHTKACIDCINKERALEKTIHGKHKTRIYRIWESMNRRCVSTLNDLSGKYYHQKGIKVCEEWRNFQNFYNWSMSHGYEDNLTIDRIDSAKGYEPDNCRWATMKEQSRNKSNSIMVTIDNVTKNLADWCEIYNISYQLGRQRITRGMDPLTAFTTPPRKRGAI